MIQKAFIGCNRKLNTQSQRHVQDFIAALLLIFPNEKLPKCSATVAWLNTFIVGHSHNGILYFRIHMYMYIYQQC